jgi:hypothetical protein
MRCRPTKLIYPNHRPPPWPNEDETRDRSGRLLGAFAPTNQELSEIPNDEQSRYQPMQQSVLKLSDIYNGAVAIVLD